MPEHSAAAWKSLPFRIEVSRGVPIYQQIIEQVIRFASLGLIGPGEQLAPPKALARQLVINANTVIHAYKELESLGVIAIAHGRGSFLKVPTSSVSDATLEASLNSLRDALLLAISHGLSRCVAEKIVAQAYTGGSDES